MRLLPVILSIVLLCLYKTAFSISPASDIPTYVEFFGDTIVVSTDKPARTPDIEHLSDSVITDFYNKIDNSYFRSISKRILTYKQEHNLDDWLYYQLIRSTAEKFSPKAENYQRYTLLKWFFLVKSGYATNITLNRDRLLLYVKSNEGVFNIPYIIKEGEQYVCLNYHDYGKIDFGQDKFASLNINFPNAQNTFSYRVTNLPDFKLKSYSEKEIQFEYYQTSYNFKLKLNSQIQKVFNNYPVVDYETYFNIPLSNITYSSLIPLLKQNIKKMSQKDGVDYLMRFTRYAFAFEADTKQFGSEKRLTPEQTLLHESSDCDDRAALFFYLVKEIYQLPMIVLSYPQHVTVAVQFDNLKGDAINYKGSNYWVCDPTPQSRDLKLGEGLPSLKKTPFDIVYAYNPKDKLNQ